MMAVMMSQQLLVRGYADHEEVDRLATSIRDEQHAEIVQMRRWLTGWFDGPKGLRVAVPRSTHLTEAPALR
jgi:hypothetical protein